MSNVSKKTNNELSSRENQRPTLVSPHTTLRHAVGWALAFIVVCVFVATEATRTLDRRVLLFTHAIPSGVFDVAASVVTVLGNFEITGLVALGLSVVGWRCRGVRGLVPLLMFFGVAIEVVLKYSLPHPGPPREFSRSVPLWPSLYLLLPPPPFFIPYAFPSGHVLRTTFLAVYVTGRAQRWRAAGWTLIIAMAVTRMYLNVHWASDVAGGLLLGIALAAAALAVDPGALESMRPSTRLTSRDQVMTGYK